MRFQKIAWVVIGSPNHKAAFRIALRLLYTVQDTHCSPPEAGKETTGTSSIAKFSDNLSVWMQTLELLSLHEDFVLMIGELAEAYVPTTHDP